MTWFMPYLAVQVRLELVRERLACADPVGARVLVREIDQLLRRVPALGVLAEQAGELRGQVDAMRTSSGDAAPLLSDAELRVLPLLATHLNIAEIAERQFVSRATVKTQAISIYRKLDVTSRSEAVERAAEIGLIDSATAAPTPPSVPCAVLWPSGSSGQSSRIPRSRSGSWSTWPTRRCRPRSTTPRARSMLNYLGDSLRVIGTADLSAPSWHPGAPQRGVVIPVRRWEDFLALSVTEIREHGSSSIQVMRRMRAMLEKLSEQVRPENRAAVQVEIARLDATVARSFSGSIDRDRAGIADRQGIGGPGRLETAEPAIADPVPPSA